MPNIISVEHRDVSISSDGVFTATNSKRVKNGISLLSLGIALSYRELGLKDTTVESLDDGT